MKDERHYTPGKKAAETEVQVNDQWTPIGLDKAMCLRCKATQNESEPQGTGGLSRDIRVPCSEMI